jgi:hypothetical protein
MNLKELKENIDFRIANLNTYEKAEEIPVLITLAESSIGARASCKIQSVSMGFDWEHGQIRIEPEQKLVRKGNSLNDAKPVVIYAPINGGRKSYDCQTCGRSVSKDDRYCRHFGQKLK